MKQPKIGLALGGGGLRGAAHVGALKVFQAAGITIDAVVGTSAGSMVGALWAAGLDPVEIEHIYRNLPENLFPAAAPYVNLIIYILQRLGILPRRYELQGLSWPRGLLRNDFLAAFIDRHTKGCSFNQLAVPAAFLACDLLSGKEVIFAPEKARSRLWQDKKRQLFFSNQSLGTAVAASSAIPGLFLPVRLDGRDMVDGGLKANVPVHLLQAWGARLIIAVDLGFAVEGSSADTIIQVLLQSSDIMGQTISDLRLQSSGAVVIRPAVENMNLYDFHRIPKVIDIGAQAAQDALPDIRRALRQLDHTKASWPWPLSTDC
ncbi:MAG: patatin-like phospholipase family protein [bacterium]